MGNGRFRVATTNQKRKLNVSSQSVADVALESLIGGLWPVAALREYHRNSRTPTIWRVA